MGKKAMVVLAQGFEEIEAVIPIDILRRAGIDVIIAGLDSSVIRGLHGVTINAENVFEGYDAGIGAFIFPGGMPCACNLAKSVKISDLILRANSEKKLIAAICASPAIVLAPTGVLDTKTATCYPGLEKKFSSKTKFTKEKVVQDGNIITSRGAGTAFEFALKIAASLTGEAKSDIVARQILFKEDFNAG